MNHRDLNRRHFLLGTSLAAVGLALGARPSLAAGKELTIATSLPSLSFPFFVHMQKQLAAEAAAQGGVKLIETDGQNQATKQTGDVEAAVTQKVDAIVISPLDVNAMAPALQAAVEAGVPV